MVGIRDRAEMRDQPFSIAGLYTTHPAKTTPLLVAPGEDTWVGTSKVRPMTGGEVAASTAFLSALIEGVPELEAEWQDHLEL